MSKESERPILTVRPATSADRPRLIPLINAAFAIEEFLEGTRTDDERLAATMKQGEMLLAEDAEGRVLGSVYMERHGKSGYMGMLAVDPSFQGRGLGRMLTEAVEERFRAEGIKMVEIVVLSFRTELPPLYQKLGYEITGTKDFKPTRPLKPGVECHGVMMAKRL